MKFAIISDVHDNIPNLDKTLNYINSNKIEIIICCGDLASRETLEHLQDNFKGTINYVFGNMDEHNMRDKKELIENSEKNENINVFESIGATTIDNIKIAFTHFPDIAKKLADEEKYHLVFFGHTHIPAMEKIKKTMIINPGNVGNFRNAPTFATFDTETKKPELILIDELK